MLKIDSKLFVDAWGAAFEANKMRVEVLEE